MRSATPCDSRKSWLITGKNDELHERLGEVNVYGILFVTAQKRFPPLVDQGAAALGWALLGHRQLEALKMCLAYDG